MEKQKRWQFYLIVAVIVLTLYNILPTVFYYTKPLHSPIDSSRAESIENSIAQRVNSLENESKAWLNSFNALLGLKPLSIDVKENDPRLVEITFKNKQDADVFKRFLPQAGGMIPFVPAQLELATDGSQIDPAKVYVTRQLGMRLDKEDLNQLFVFSPVKEQGTVSSFYQKIIQERAAQVAAALGGNSKTAAQVYSLTSENKTDARSDEMAVSLARDLVEFENAFGKNSAITKRYYASLFQLSQSDSAQQLQRLIERLDSLKTKLTNQKNILSDEQTKASEQNLVFDSEKLQTLNQLNTQTQTLDAALAILRKNTAVFQKPIAPLNRAQLNERLASLPSEGVQTLSLEGTNPFIAALLIDWNANQISLQFYPDVQEIRAKETKNESSAYGKERLNQLIINDLAAVSRLTEENFLPNADTFTANFNSLANTQSVLAMDLGYVAEKQAKQLLDQLKTSWTPSHPDLVFDTYPIRDYRQYRQENAEDQKLGLVVYAPSMDENTPLQGFRYGSLYVIAKGMNSIIQQYEQASDSPQADILGDDIQKLQSIMKSNGFIGYAGNSYGLPKEFSKDVIFELDDYYSMLLKATREDFVVKGNSRYAVLDFSDVEQRILTENKIADRMQEDLIKWKEEYGAAQVELNGANRYLVPKPTKNVYWENFKLSAAKYFKGDDRKIIKWGLDLSGGKTVRIGLRDQNNRPVTNPDDLKQAVNELYTRINKMGVSERTIRIENNNIVLDFPGSQNMSAADLVRASAMYFHVVNEKFTPSNPSLKEYVNQFLQEVWNEAVVTNRKTVENINEIAWQHLGGDSSSADFRPRSEAAKQLYDNGLRLANPRDNVASSSFDDSLSSIAVMRGDSFADWDNQSHPLLVVFNHYALEGASLTNIQAGYDPSEGNMLTFNVKRSFDSANRSGSPRDDFYAWTSQFSEDKIAGTPRENYSQGRGWRMAVILNGTVISKPSLKAALRDSATISGRFSQREVNQLAADLKAGSLSYTPKILSEENVSPELGKEERFKGMAASIIAVILVVVAMVGYYHFAGVVASFAVLFNILIMWGVLQNIGSALSLPGIAGIVLTIGMAVDANVLVFERIREEFAISGRIGSAIQAGYKKAFSAIVDSNITTIIAALILIQFDSGPVKGFAVTLIIGILSSMFTALFMTRYFFAGWVQNPKNKALTMSQFIGKTHFDFLGQAKKAIGISLVVMILGTYLFLAQSKTMFGMDFTGGYALDVELKEQVEQPASYRTLAGDALMANGATVNDFQIRELNRPNHLRIQLGTTMEEKGHPFYQLPESVANNTTTPFEFDYEANPRLAWLINALESKGLQVDPALKASLDQRWTVISGQFSDTMRNNAILGLTIALISILVYITLRFEFKYAIAAVIGLVHDVIITLGILAFFRWIGLQVQIDLQVVGALMTIIGYSLNDTIIVFDRIREDVHVLRKMKYKDIVNHALNVTLSRTLMTSGTTLLVLLTLVLMGGSSIFTFALVMTIGVIVGTLSSLFIAAPALLYFHDREVKLQQEKELNPRNV